MFVKVIKDFKLFKTAFSLSRTQDFFTTVHKTNFCPEIEIWIFEKANESKCLRKLYLSSSKQEKD